MISQEHIARERGSLLALILTLLTVGFTALTLYEQGSWGAPPEPGDGPDYDNIALNLAEGRGFGLFWDDPGWRAPYEAANASGDFDSLLARKGDFRITAQRPPLYPLFLAAFYSSIGRDFTLVRLAHVVLFGAAVLLIMNIMTKEAGLAPLALFSLLVVRDPSIALWSYYIYSEALAVFLLTLLFVMLRGLTRNSSQLVGRACIVGLTLALLVLTRHLLVFFVPVTLALVWKCAKQNAQGANFSKIFLSFVLSLIVVLAPWTIRNYFATGMALPMGTQGGMNLAFDYSDQAVKSNGVWTGRNAAPIFAEFASAPENRAFSDTIHRETAQNVWGNRKAIDWIISNPGTLMQLVWDRAFSLFWRDALFFQRILIILSVLTLGIARGRTDRLAWLFVFTNAVAVSLTHTVPAGRFLVPVELLLSYLIAIQTAGFCRHYSARSSDQVEICKGSSWNRVGSNEF